MSNMRVDVYDDNGHDCEVGNVDDKYSDDRHNDTTDIDNVDDENKDEDHYNEDDDEFK